MEKYAWGGHSGRGRRAQGSAAGRWRDTWRRTIRLTLLWASIVYASRTSTSTNPRRRCVGRSPRAPPDHNYLTEWLDDGINNVPWGATSNETFTYVFAFFERFLPNSTKLGTWSMVLQHVNKALEQQHGACPFHPASCARHENF